MARQSSFRTATALTGPRWVALARAAAWIFWTRAVLTLRPWNRVAPAFERDPVRSGPPNWSQAKIDLWAVEAVARRVLPEKPCLTQALVARKLLRRHGVDTTLRLGAARTGQRGFRAHAWLEHNGTTVIGRTQGDSYIPFAPLSQSVDPELNL
ncbi:lasso peptide biosynthesis B2 protein [Rubrivirga sp.]|uniref:lasso peptide biosynthesis B2 protein n=1 Tax=Rubrivirga sp. TaxID=1885344 RepID=UPI003C740998